MYPPLSSARPWSWGPNWGEKVVGRYEFKTDLITSRSGKEQRRALRNTARRSVSWSSLADGEDFRAQNQFMRLSQNQPVVIAEWSKFASTTVSVSGGTNVLTFTSLPVWMVEGQPVVLFLGAQSLAATIASVTSTTATLDDSLPTTCPAGTRVYPALMGLLDPTIKATQVTGSVQTLAMRHSTYPGFGLADTGGDPVTTFNGIEVFTATPNWGTEVSADMLWPVEQVDFGRGRIAEFRPIKFPAQVRQLTFLQRSASEAYDIIDFFLRQQGQRGEFYLPSQTDDLVLAVTASSGGTTLTVPGTDLADLGVTPFEALCVRMRDGTKLYRTVTGVTPSGANSVIQCALGTWPTALTTDNVAGISWMPRCRFASDILEVSWITSTVAEIQTSFQSLKPE